MQQQPATPRHPDAKRERALAILRVLSIVAMLWMVYEVLGVSNLFGYGGLSNDDLEDRRMGDALTAIFDPIAWVVTTFILVVSIVINSVAKRIASRVGATSTTTKVSMIISIVFYVLGFFRVSMIFPMIFAGIGSMGQTMENPSDQRVPTSEELVIAAPQLVQYNDSNGTRISTSLTNATEEHWEFATVVISVLAEDGTQCLQHEIKETWLAPGEHRDITSTFFDPAVYYSDPSCVPGAAEIANTVVDIDSRSEIDQARYQGSSTQPVYAMLTPVEESGILPSIVNLSVHGKLAEESLGLIRSDGSFEAGFEVADAQGVRLAWCFRPHEIAEDGSFTTRNFHSPIDPGVYLTAVAVPEC